MLVVDDTPENLDVLVGILKPHYKLKLATHGQKALDICASHPPDLILLDVMMPGMDGLEVCRRLKQMRNCYDIPVIFVTALQDACDEVEGFEAGCVDYIHKPLSPAIVLARVKSHLQLQASRQFIRNTFGRYLSDDIVSQIIDTPGGLEPGGEMRELSILMADLRGFTRISEAMPAAHILQIVNTYLDVMTDIILRHKGTIEEFIGDGILATFGAPVGLADHALQAVHCAIEMQQAIPSLNKRLMVLGLPQIEMGIGIHTGKAIVGNIGCKKRMKYGAIGQVVNIAARIESCAIGGQVMVSEVTRQACQGKLEFRGTHQVRFKGVSMALALHDVAAIQGERRLPEVYSEVMNKLPDAVDVSLLILRDKTVHDTVAASITAVGSSAIGICCQSPLEKLMDVEIVFHVGMHDGVYAKVIDVDPDDHRKARLYITYAPVELRVLLHQQWRQQKSS